MQAGQHLSGTFLRLYHLCKASFCGTLWNAIHISTWWPTSLLVLLFKIVFSFRLGKVSILGNWGGHKFVLFLFALGIVKTPMAFLHLRFRIPQEHLHSNLSSKGKISYLASFYGLQGLVRLCLQEWRQRIEKGVSTSSSTPHKSRSRQ